MITGWLLKLIIGIGVLGLAAFELGSPLVANAQLDDIAHEVADGASQDFFENRNFDSAKAEAQRIVDEKKGVKLLDFTMEGQAAKVKVQKDARSIILKNFGPTEDWYDVEVTASGATRDR